MDILNLAIAIHDLRASSLGAGACYARSLRLCRPFLRGADKRYRWVENLRVPESARGGL